MNSDTPAKTARQLYRELKEGGASETIIQGIVEQRATHPLDLAAKTMVGLLGVLPRAREGQMGVVLVLRSLLIDTLTLFGQSDPGDMAASEEDLAVARMLLRDVEAIERHLESPPAPG